MPRGRQHKARARKHFASGAGRVFRRAGGHAAGIATPTAEAAPTRATVRRREAAVQVAVQVAVLAIGSVGVAAALDDGPAARAAMAAARATTRKRMDA